MVAITFDTQKFVDRLKHSGIIEKQAKAISGAFREAHAEMEIATKHDIALIRRDLKEMEYRLIIKLGLMIFASFSLTITILGAMIKFL